MSEHYRDLTKKEKEVLNVIVNNIEGLKNEELAKKLNITRATFCAHLMNIYYKSRQHIDILGFWLQIAKMSVAPIAVSIAASYLLCGQDIDSWSELLKYILIYLAAYLPMLYIFSLNTYERGLLKELFMNLKRIVSR
jgi:hypothetical protein